MNYNRYRIVEGRYEFHTFLKGQEFGSAWLENLGNFTLDINGKEYTHYLPDMVDGMYVPDTVTINELALANQKIVSKSERQIACDALVVTITNGKQFNGDKKAIADLKNAIETSREYAILYPNEAPLTETTWKLYDNTIQTVTFAELQEAYVRGNLQYQETFISFG